MRICLWNPATSSISQSILDYADTALCIWTHLLVLPCFLSVKLFKQESVKMNYTPISIISENHKLLSCIFKLNYVTILKWLAENLFQKWAFSYFWQFFKTKTSLYSVIIHICYSLKEKRHQRQAKFQQKFFKQDLKNTTDMLTAFVQNTWKRTE